MAPNQAITYLKLLLRKRNMKIPDVFVVFVCIIYLFNSEYANSLNSNETFICKPWYQNNLPVHAEYKTFPCSNYPASVWILRIVSILALVWILKGVSVSAFYRYTLSVLVSVKHISSTLQGPSKGPYVFTFFTLYII